MAEDEDNYVIERDESVLVRAVGLEIVLIQVLRELSELKHRNDEDDQARFVRGLQAEAERFNNLINASNTPQDKAWIKELSKYLGIIYDGALIPTLADE